VLAPGAIVDPEDLRIPGEQPGTPIVVLEDLGEVPHGHRFRARQGKSLLLLTVLVPDVTMQRELRDLLSYQIVQAGEVAHPNLLPTYGCVPLPLGEDGLETLFVVRPDPGCPTLRHWLHEVWQAGHVLDPLNAVAITVQICEALAALHNRFAHGYVTPDNVLMYPTGGMPQSLLTGTCEGALLPYTPGFDRFKQAGFLPQAGPELLESPHEPRVETDVLGAAALVLEILTGQPLEAGMSLAHLNLPPRLQKVLEVASRADPEDRPQDILMFSRRLQAAVGLGDDPSEEPSAVLEPIHHGDHADPRYPAVRAKPWRPPPPAPPPWAERAAAGPTPGSGAWNVGAPTPGSGAWNVGASGSSGAWNVGAPTPGSGAWNVGAPSPGSGAWRPPPPAPPAPAPPAPAPPAPASASWSPTALGESFPVDTSSAPSAVAEAATLPGYAHSPSSAPVSRTELPPPPPSKNPTATSVSIMMPAPDGSVMAPLGSGPANFVILRRGKRYGPYSQAQLDRLIPMGKLRSVDAVEVVSSGEQILAVDIPGLRPTFEARARDEEQAARPPSPVLPASPSPPPDTHQGRPALWIIIALLALSIAAIGTVLALG